MAHFAVLAPSLAGHFNPLLVLADTLIERGHRITFIGQPDAAILIGSRSVGFVPVGAADYPLGSLERRIEGMARLRGPVGAGRTIKDVARLTDMLCREAPDAVKILGADAILADQMEAAGGLVAEKLGLPFVSIANALPINREETIPPPYVGWAYDPSPRGQWWARGGWRITDYLMRSVNRTIEHHAARFGLPGRRRTEDCLSDRLQIAQAIPGLDFPRRELPANFHYLGPFRSAKDAEWELPEEDGRPLAFCSLGTLQGSRGAIFRKVGQACDALGLRLVIAHGGRLRSEIANSLPGNPLVYDFVPQRAVLKQAALAITHAGFNTVLDALSFGVPLVAMPLAFEQPATAARLKRAGVAEVVSAGVSVAALQRAIAKVLEEKAYRAAAARLQAEIAVAGGASRAAELIELSLR